MKMAWHLTLPELSNATEEEHFAPLLWALEGMATVNEHVIRWSMRRAARGVAPVIPPVYASGVRYQEDPAGKEDWRDCLQVMSKGTGDCLPLATLVLRDDYTAIPLYALAPGDRIMGQSSWTMVRECVMTGDKPILSFKLSNGCVLRCSRDHRLFRDVDGRIEEIRAEQACVGDDLAQLAELPMATREDLAWPDSLARLSNEDRAWLLGVFVADGWTDQYRCAISGLDGHAKETQKRRVESLMASVGIDTRWHRKYIAINDRAITDFFARCGRHATNKHLESVRFASREAIQATLDGLAADASIQQKHEDGPRTLIYGTTSPRLALQLRVLYRMLGVSTSFRRVDDHGGFGEHPIYRVIPRLLTRDGYAERRDKKFARIRAIADGGVEPCGDIQTDEGRFWLPESDVMVHNCDNLVAWRLGELRVARIPAQAAIKWQHIPKEVAASIMKADGTPAYPAHMVPDEGLWLVHCSVQHGDGTIEDISKNLGMGGHYTSGV